MKPASPEEGALAAELYAVANRGLRRLSVTVKGTGPISPTVLQRIADVVESALFRSNPTDAFIRIIERAISELEGSPAQYPQVTWRELGADLYDPDPVDNYDTRIQAWRVRCGPHVNADTPNFKAMTSDLRILLARKLLAREQRANALKGARHDLDYVPRPALEEQLSAYLDSDDRVILIHGEAGTGKSTLAEHAIRQYEHVGPHDYICRIQADNNDILAGSLCALFVRRGEMATARAPLHALKLEFRMLLGSDKAPPIILLDGIQDQALLDELVPSHPRSRVVVTSRKQVADGNQVKHLAVSNMEPVEACDLVKLHAASLADNEVAVIAEALDRRPLAIVHGCACLINAPYNGDTDQFRAALARNVAAVLDSYGSDEELTLTAIYKMILSQLAAHPDVLLLLDIVSFIGPSESFKQLLLLAWPCLGSWSDAQRGAFYDKLLPEDEGLLAKALRVASRWNLVAPDAEFRAMHELTRKIIRILRAEHDTEVASGIFSCLYNRLAMHAWPGGQPLPQAWPRLARVLANISRKLPPTPQLSSISHPVLLRELRETGFLSSMEKMAPLSILILRSIASEPALAPRLSREMLELGYLRGGRLDTDDDSPLSFVRRHTPSPYVHEALLASDFLPLSEDWQVETVEAGFVEYLNDIGPHNMVERAQHAYALGVLLFENAKWNDATTCYMHSRAIYQELAKREPSFNSYVAECTRRLLELSIRANDRSLTEESRTLLFDYWIPTLGSDRAGDMLLFRRNEQSVKSLAISLDLERLISEPSYRAPYLPDDVNDIAELVEFYSKCELLVPAFEAQYTYWRGVALIAPSQAFHGFMRLATSYSDLGWRNGERISMLASSKVGLLHDPGEITTETIFHIALSATKALSRSPYWHADALCVAYAVALLGEPAAQDHIEWLRRLTVNATTVIQRPDKLAIAEAVGSGATPLLLLIE